MFQLARRIAVLIILISISSSFGHSKQPGDPNLIFINGQIITMEEDQPFATALSTKEGEILQVGSDADLLATLGATTELIDLEGRTMIPGFVDAHTHLFGSRDFWGESLSGMQDLALENGITTFGHMFSTPDFIAEIRAFEATGGLRVRTNLYLHITDNCGSYLGDWYTDYPLDRDMERRLRILGVKLFTDGGSCLRPAISFEYKDTGGHGDLFHTQEFISELTLNAHNRGYQVAIHAQGDLAIEQALNAIEAALDGKPNELRHRIEHNAFIRDDQLPRYSEIGVVPTLFGTYLTCSGIEDGRYAEVFGEDQLWWLEHWRRFLDANPDVIAAWHGDDPGVLPVSPILELYGFVTRNQIREETSEVCEAPDWLKEFSISVEEALRLMTINAAYALFMEDSIGSLKAGKFADFVILSENPLSTPVEEIKDVEILATYLAGNIEYCRAGQQAICTNAPLDEGSNIALNKPVSASISLESNPPEMVVDGDLDNWWSAGDFATQWIEIDLLESRSIANIKLTPSQDPAGVTHHRIWGRASENASLRLLHEFNGTTQDFEALEFSPQQPWQNIQFLRIETISSPSWIAWREIEIYDLQ
jgi:predicted amidohydrolase YtcJ